MKIIKVKVRLDSLILALLTAFSTGAVAGIGGFYYGVSFTKEYIENREEVYHANFVEKEDSDESEPSTKMVKISF
jgi:hypothetical protein